MRRDAQHVRGAAADVDRKKPVPLQQFFIPVQRRAEMSALVIDTNERYAERRGKRLRLLESHQKHRHVAVRLRRGRRADRDRADRIPVHLGKQRDKKRRKLLQVLKDAVGLPESPVAKRHGKHRPSLKDDAPPPGTCHRGGITAGIDSETDPHRLQCVFATAPRMPLTKPGDLSPPNAFAISTASLTVAPTGMPVSYKSS